MIEDTEDHLKAIAKESWSKQPPSSLPASQRTRRSVKCGTCSSEVKNHRELEGKLNQIRVGQHTIQAILARKQQGQVDQIQNSKQVWNAKKHNLNSSVEKDEWCGLDVEADEEHQPNTNGREFVLISCHDVEELKHLAEHGREWLAQWFLEVRPWTPKEVAAEHFKWLRCQGVPLHIWKSSFFEIVMCLFRKFISLDGSTIRKKRLDVAKILILIAIQENIQKVLKVKVGDSIFHIRVTKEAGIDNLFSLKSDFTLCRDDASILKDWSEDSNEGLCKDEEDMGNWRIIKDDEELVASSYVVELVPKKFVMSSKSKKEVERVSETTGMYENSFNARVQNSNSMAVDGKFERIDGIEAVEKEVDSIGTKKEGK
ncbi:hypothetical protein SLEP1_g40020 [Rubroshorea leprosula]|uniref:DUF4283 domain-containing protein n=1 Tax=Rubroshorea leprosula TaxID=152421 RepID=A0AAV5L2H7_9ROSI|nr:hypothetical protein SLEP1_g40020 [Rubroshorea leprosula]